MANEQIAAENAPPQASAGGGIDFSLGDDPAAATEGEGIRFDLGDSAGTPPSTFGEKVGAGLEMGAGGLIETAPAAAGAAIGATLGTAVMPGPGTLIGGIGGLVAGSIAGSIARDRNIRQVEDLPLDQRPFGVFGEITGGSIPFIALPGLTAMTGARAPAGAIGNWLNGVMDSYRAHPLRMVRMETIAALSAGTAGSVSEQAFPGNRMLRFMAEVTTGVGSTTRFTTNAAEFAWTKAKNLFQRARGPGRTAEAAKSVAAVVEEAGDDPQVLIELLSDQAFWRDAGLEGLTGGQKTGVPSLVALEQGLAKQSPKFSADAARRAAAGMEATKNILAVLRGTGDPEMLKAAIEIQERYFRGLMADGLERAKVEALEIASQLTDTTPTADAMALLGKAARKTVAKSVREARKVETQLWNKVPRDLLLADAPTLRGTIKGMAEAGGVPAELINQLRRVTPKVAAGAKGEDLGAVEIRKFLNQLMSIHPDLASGGMRGALEEGADKAIEVTSGALLSIRSTALKLARDATFAGRAGDAHEYGQIAEAAMQDLIDTPFSMPTLDEARSWSRAFNETVTRAFGGRALATTRRGPLIPAETLMRRALTGGKEAAALRMEELSEAVRFMDAKGAGTRISRARIAMMDQIQAETLTLAAGEAVDPVTGRLKPAALRGFMANNKALMARFPAVRERLSRAFSSEMNAQRLADLAAGKSGVDVERKMFERFLDFESPSQAIGDVLSSRHPAGELKALAVAAREGGERVIPGGGDRAIRGLRAGLWDEMWVQAGGDAKFDPARLREVFLTPPRPGRPSVAEVAVEAGRRGPRQKVSRRGGQHHLRLTRLAQRVR